MISLILFFYLCLAAVVKCTIVIDEANQNDHPSKKYCNATKACEEGTHVMCMYYKPELPMGARCHGSLNVTLTPETEELMQDIINHIRSKMANGEETGKDGEQLPKAFGMMRLMWDEELASFAQVWTNQCTAALDACRATSRFDHPGQVLNLVRFSHPEWKMVSTKPLYLDEKGFTENKMRYAVETAVKAAYSQKNKVTQDMITNFPDLTAMTHLASIRGYMIMIHAGVTHMGCAMSTYLDYHALATSHKNVVYNTVQIVCNFSNEPKAGSSVILTKPIAGASLKCGCPPGTEEDDDCLCVAVPLEAEESGEKMRICDTEDPACTPSVVLLPIITVEDAPPEKLYKTRLTNNSVRTGSTHKSSTKNMFKSLEILSDDDFLDSEVLIPNKTNFSAVDLLRRLNEHLG